MERIFDVRRSIRRAVQTLEIGLILCEQERIGFSACQRVSCPASSCWAGRLWSATRGLEEPCVSIGRLGARPRDPRPQLHVLRNHNVGRMTNRCASGPRLKTRIADQDVVGARFGILDEDIEVAVAVKNARVGELVFWVLLSAFGAGLNQIFVRERRAADTCRASSCRNEWAWNPGRSSIP